MFRRLGTALVFFLALVQGVSAEVFREFVPISPWPVEGNLSDVIVNDGVDIAVGPNNSVLYSFDGVAWMRGTSPRFVELRSLAPHPDLGSVAVGDGGVVLSSIDGRQWVERLSPGSADLVAITCLGSSIIVAQQDGVIALSTDVTESWLHVDVPAASHLVGLATDGESVVVVGNGVWRSDDGFSWTRVDQEDWAWPQSGDLAFQDVIHADVGFAVLSNSGLLISHDGGRSWAFEQIDGLDELGPPMQGDVRWRLASGPDTVVVTAGYRNPEPPPWDFYDAFLAIRRNGGEWRSFRSSGPGPAVMVNRDGWWLALPQEYDRSPLLGTADLETWTPLASERPIRSVGADAVTAAAWNGERLLVCSGEFRFNQGWCWTGKDYLNWDVSSAPSLMEEVDWFTGRWLGLASIGMSVVASFDGSNWSEITIPGAEGALWNDLAVADGKVVLVGQISEDSVVVVSEDLVRWQVQISEGPPFTRIAPIPWSLQSPPGFVALAAGGMVATSLDGIDWEREIVPGAPDLHDVAHAGGLWREIVAIGWNGVIATKSDGEDWRVTNTEVGDLTNVWYEGYDFLISTSSGILQETWDGDWEPARSPIGSVVEVWTSGNDPLAIGRGGAIAFGRRWDGQERVRSEYLRVIPVAAATEGLDGTRWASDIFAANPQEGWTLVDVRIDYLNPWIQTALPPGSATTILDILRRAEGGISELVSVKLESTNPIAAVSKIWTSLSEGEMAQTIPVLEEWEIVKDTGPALLPLLREEWSYRTNIGIWNDSGLRLDGRLEVFDGEGRSLGQEPLEPVGPGMTRQFTRPTRWFTNEAVKSGFAAITIEENPYHRWTAWTSVIDRITGDATFHLAQKPTDQPFVIAAAVHVQGAGSTRWRTNLTLVNPADDDVVVQVVPLPSSSWEGSLEPVTVAISARSTTLFEDVALSLWNGHGVAALLVEPQEGAVAAASRTFTVGDDGGTFGQGIEPMAVSEEAGGSMWIPGIREDQGHRTNFGVINVHEEPVDVILVLHHATGNVVMRRNLVVPARGLLQINQPLAALDYEISNGAAEVKVTSPGGRVLAWASVVDNASGDAVFIPARTAVN